MLKTLVHKFGPDLFARLKDIAEKQVPAKLKPIVVSIKFPHGYAQNCTVTSVHSHRIQVYLYAYTHLPQAGIYHNYTPTHFSHTT